MNAADRRLADIDAAIAAIRRRARREATAALLAIVVLALLAAAPALAAEPDDLISAEAVGWIALVIGLVIAIATFATRAPDIVDPHAEPFGDVPAGPSHIEKSQ